MGKLEQYENERLPGDSESYQWAEGHDLFKEKLAQAFAVGLLEIKVEEARLERRRHWFVRRVICTSPVSSARTSVGAERRLTVVCHIRVLECLLDRNALERVERQRPPQEVNRFGRGVRVEHRKVARLLQRKRSKVVS